MSREGSRASRLTQDRAEMLVTGLPSCTTSRLALVSFPESVEAKVKTESRENQNRGYRNRGLWPALPVAMSKRKEKTLPRSSPAQSSRPGASKDRARTRPVSLLEPPFTFLPVEMFMTCTLCLAFPTCGGTHTPSFGPIRSCV